MDLRNRHADIDVRLQSSDREPELIDEGIDLAIRRGSGGWPDCHAVLLAAERIFPVAAPRVMAEAGLMHTPADMMRQRLIHLEEPVRQRPSWRDWFAHHGQRNAPLKGGLRLNDYA